MAVFPVIVFSSATRAKFENIGFADVAGEDVRALDVHVPQIRRAADVAGSLGRIRFAMPRGGNGVRGGLYAFLLWAVRNPEKLRPVFNPADRKADDPLPFYGAVTTCTAAESMTALSQFDTRYVACGILSGAEHARYRYEPEFLPVRRKMVEETVEAEELDGLPFMALGARCSAGDLIRGADVYETLDVDFADGSQLRLAPEPVEILVGTTVAAKGKLAQDDRLKRLRTDVSGRA